METFMEEKLFFYYFISFFFFNEIMKDENLWYD